MRSPFDPPPGIGPDSFDELERFDETYRPAEARRPGLDSLPTGEYDFEILQAELTRTPKERELIFRMELKVTSHGAQLGQVIDHVYFFRRQESVDYLGADLCSLGFDADRWTPANGRQFSKELPRAVAQLAGMRFRGRVTRTKGDNKEFVNLWISAKLAGRPMPGTTPAAPPPPPQQPVAAPAGGTIPF